MLVTVYMDPMGGLHLNGTQFFLGVIKLFPAVGVQPGWLENSMKKTRQVIK